MSAHLMRGTERLWRYRSRAASGISGSAGAESRSLRAPLGRSRSEGAPRQQLGLSFVPSDPSLSAGHRFGQRAGPGSPARPPGPPFAPGPPPPAAASFLSAQVAGAAHLGPPPSLPEVRGSHLTGSARPTAPPPAAAQRTEPAVGVPGGRRTARDGSQPPRPRAGSPTAAAPSASGCRTKTISGAAGGGEKLTAARRTLPPRRPSAPTHPSMSSAALPGAG